MKKFLCILMALALTVGCFAGCGGGTTETEAPATDTPATEAPATEAPSTEAPATEAPAGESSGTFTIGMIGPLTGGAAIYGTAVANAARSPWTRSTPLGGPVQFELLTQDDTNDAETAVNAYNNLMDQGMQILLGTVTTTPGPGRGALHL